jgi:hypothetical protein
MTATGLGVLLFMGFLLVKIVLSFIKGTVEIYFDDDDDDLYMDDDIGHDPNLLY